MKSESKMAQLARDALPVLSFSFPPVLFARTSWLKAGRGACTSVGSSGSKIGYLLSYQRYLSVSLPSEACLILLNILHLPAFLLFVN